MDISFILDVGKSNASSETNGERCGTTSVATTETKHEELLSEVRTLDRRRSSLPVAGRIGCLASATVPSAIVAFWSTIPLMNFSTSGRPKMSDTG